MRVGIFLETTSEEKQIYMHSFAEGIVKLGDRVDFVTKKIYRECDLALVFGYYGINKSESHEYRKHVIDEHQRRGKKCIYLDADLLRFAGKRQTLEQVSKLQHLRVSYESIFPDKAYYFNEKSDSERWELLCERKDIIVKPYRTDGNHILICMNSGLESRGWSNKGENTYKWLIKTIREIRKITDRTIQIRFHPNEDFKIQKHRPLKDIINVGGKNITFSGGVISDLENMKKGTSLQDDCDDAWACVVFTTSASVIPIIEGIPVFTDRKDCIAYPIANHNIGSYIKEPSLNDRRQWFYDISYSIWNMEEMREGIVWERFKKRLNSRGEISKKKNLELNLK